MRIGFIGLGTMGGAAALNLIKGGHQLTVCDLDSERAKQHLELGATWADTPAIAAKDANIVFTMVHTIVCCTRITTISIGVIW